MYRLLLLAVLTAIRLLASGSFVSVAGEWAVRLDPDDRGITERWFASTLSGDHISLPGSTDEHRIGARNNRRELRRLTRVYEFTGPAWYQRQITIPTLWRDKQVMLFLERCHWETQVWLDDRPLGLQNSLSAPHIHSLPSATDAGLHRLTIRVDNRLRIDVGQWASGVSEEGPSNWNGIIGRLELQATDPVWIDAIQVIPDATAGTIHAVIHVRNITGQFHRATLAAIVMPPAPGTSAPFSRDVSVGARPLTTLQMDLPLTSTVLWDLWNPAIYHLSVSLKSQEAGVFSADHETTFGVRQISRDGKLLRLNARTIFLRGTVDNGSFPLTGHAPTDVETWRTRFATYRQYGINHVRFHSWCPPEAAFQAADVLGLILQVENPMWIGDGRVSADTLRTAFIRQEAERIVDTYGNHPSFCLMSMGNELGTGLDPFVTKLVTFLQSRDSRRLYTSTSAPDNMLRPDDYFVSAGPRWQNLRGDPRLERLPPDTEFDYREYLAAIDRPVVAHELGQWTVLPDLAEQAKYQGALEPRYFDIYRELMDKNALTSRNAQFTGASGALMAALYKEEIESTLRTPGLSGFQLLGLTDWPGFGPAFTGILDTFGDSRGFISPEAFRRFCDDTVPLLRLKKRAWTTDETLTGAVSVAHYGPDPLNRVEPVWTVRDAGGNPVASGRMDTLTLAAGGIAEAGTLDLSLQRLSAPAKYSIEIRVADHANDWKVWLYPEKLPEEPAQIVIATSWDDKARDSLRQGRTVLFLANQAKLRNTVPSSFTTVFWSLVWFPKRPETMGLLCDPKHPALAEFPTDFHSDWQWWDLMSQSRALVIDDAPRQLEPVVRVIDDVNRSHRLAAVFEARVARGRLLATTFDLESSLRTRLSARQLRHSLIAYAASDKFDPRVELAMEYLDRLFENHSGQGD